MLAFKILVEHTIRPRFYAKLLTIIDVGVGCKTLKLKVVF